MCANTVNLATSTCFYVRLVTKSNIFSWLFTIKDRYKKCGFSVKTQSRFALVVFIVSQDCRSQHLTHSTPNVSEVLEAPHEVGLRALKGRRVEDSKPKHRNFQNIKFR